MMGEKIPVGSDHAGYELKQHIIENLKELGYEPEDVGTHGTQPVDYPDYAAIVAGKVASGERTRGILVCGSGLGMSIAANRFTGVRATLAVNGDMVEIGRRHNDSNILALGGRVVGPAEARSILKKWLETPFQGGRHLERVKKMDRL